MVGPRGHGSPGSGVKQGLPQGLLDGARPALGVEYVLDIAGMGHATWGDDGDG